MASEYQYRSENPDYHHRKDVGDPSLANGVEVGESPLASVYERVKVIRAKTIQSLHERRARQHPSNSK
jgi:hypothetical protein